MFVLLLFVASKLSFAQQERLDSLRRILQGITTPENRVKFLLDIAKNVYNSMPDSSMSYCEEAEKLSKKHNLEVHYAYSLNCEARYLLLKGDLKNSISKLNEAIGIFERNNEKKGLAKSYSLKAIALGRLNKYKEELDYLLRAKHIYVTNQNKEDLAGVLTNLSNAYCKVNKYQSALDALKELDKLELPENGSKFFTEISYGNIYQSLGQYEEAIAHYEKCVQTAHQFRMIDSEITGLTEIAKCYQELNQIAVAKSYYYQALNLAKFNNLIVEEADALKGIINVFESEKDFRNAFYSLRQFQNIEDSIFNLEKIKSINEVENRLTLAEKEKIIALQNFALEREKVELTASKNRAILLIIGLIAAIGAFLSTFYYSRKTKKLASTIQKQKVEVENQKEIIESKNKDLTDSINYARYIQGSMLPSTKTMNDSFSEHFVIYKPKDIVAGDFYWTENVYGKPTIAVCDCTGHGVPGAMVSIVAGNALNRAIREFKLYNPALIFDKVNQIMQETFTKSEDYTIADGMDAVICVLDYDNRKLHISAANNPVWIVSPPSKDPTVKNESWLLSQIAADKQPIGKYKEESGHFQLKSVNMEKGEMVYLFTDGIADQFGGPKGKKFKYKQLQEVLTSIAKHPCATQKEMLAKIIDDWRGNLDQVDDILIIGIRV